MPATPTRRDRTPPASPPTPVRPPAPAPRTEERRPPAPAPAAHVAPLVSHVPAPSAPASAPPPRAASTETTIAPPPPSSAIPCGIPWDEHASFLERIRRDSEKSITWNRGNEQVSAILARGLREVLPSDLSPLFPVSDRVLRCIDEGMPGGFHLRGAGVLHPFETVYEWLHDERLSGVTSHARCGGAALAARRLGLDPAKADAFGIEFATQVAAKLRVPYLGHVDAEMKRPKGFHPARAIYVDGVGQFNPTALQKLPCGFTVSRQIATADVAAEEVGFCIETAFGEHGFGDRFTRESPLLLLVIGPRALRAEFYAIVEAHSGRIAIDGCEVGRA